MSRFRIIQTNFLKGELDPLVAGRVDLDGYFQGAKTLRNWAAFAQGGIMRRPGTTYTATLQGKSRLVPFQFSKDERYLFAFSDQRLDVYDTDGVAVTNITSCPWTEAQLFALDFAQWGDVMWVVHQDMPIQEITRTSASTFSRAAMAFEAHSSGYPVYEPYFKFAVEATTITPSATTGSITLTTSADHWVSDHVGVRVRVGSKTCTITGYTSATVVNATVNETLSGTSATGDWDEQVFSAVQGYPGCVALHEQRLWLAGTENYPSFIAASNTTAFRKFDVGAAGDDESIQISLGSDGINEIRFIVSGRHLQVFTDSGEFYPPLTSGEPLTPSNVAFRRQTAYGCKRITPQNVDGATLFLQETGPTVREFVYDDVAQAYGSDAISLFSPHLLSAPTQAAHITGNSQRPEQYVFYVNTDGTVAVFHTARAESISGWMLWSTRSGDEIVSINAVGPNLFACVKRSINSSTVYYLEKFSEEDDVTLDCSKDITGSGQTFSGLTHLANEEVYLIANGVSLGAHTVNGSGEVTITETGVTAMSAGLYYAPSLETMPPDTGTSTGPLTGEIRRISRVTVVMNTALSMKVAGTELIVRQVTDDLSDPPTAVTDTRDFYLRGYSRNPTVTITQTDPLSLRILALVMEISF